MSIIWAAQSQALAKETSRALVVLGRHRRSKIPERQAILAQAQHALIPSRNFTIQEELAKRP